MSNIRVGVLRGGRGHEYGVSLETGRAVLEHLPTEKYRGHDILITKDGQWHWSGLPTSREKISKQVDVVFNALHGEYGEDGKVQNVLDGLGLPYTGSGSFASAVGMNKVMANKIFRQAGLRVPHGILLERPRRERPDQASGGAFEEIAGLAREVFNRVSPYWIVKPADGGSSVGVYKAKNFDGLMEALYRAFQYSPRLLVEQCIEGREATCGVVEHFRDRRHYALPPVEIRKLAGQAVWSYDAKYNGRTEEICPGNFSQAIKKEINELAIKAHEALGLRHYSRADFIVSPHGIYLLEINTLPGLTPASLLPKALGAVGCSYGDFLDHVITLAMTGR